jgi:hypothetical protein
METAVESRRGFGPGFGERDEPGQPTKGTTMTSQAKRLKDAVLSAGLTIKGRVIPLRRKVVDAANASDHRDAYELTGVAKAHFEGSAEQVDALREWYKANRPNFGKPWFHRGTHSDGRHWGIIVA